MQQGQTGLTPASVPVGSSPLGVAVNPVTNMVYVTNWDDNTVSVIDGKTNSIVRDIQVGVSPTHVTINPVTNMVYVTNRDDNTVSVIDGKINTVVKTLRVGSYPEGLNANETITYESFMCDNGSANVWLHIVPAATIIYLPNGPHLTKCLRNGLHINVAPEHAVHCTALEAGPGSAPLIAVLQKKTKSYPIDSM